MDQNLQQLLKSVSRTFALSLFSLPFQQRSFVSTCYLLARTADTLADAGSWNIPLRLSYLDTWEKAVFKENSDLFKVKDSVGGFAPSEAELLLNSPSIIDLYSEYSDHEKSIARELFEVLFQGMRRLLKARNETGEKSVLIVHNTSQDFDWYCYAHAGCVGRFWTQIFLLPQHLEPLAIEYGKGLERVNILRDLKEDRAAGLVLLDKESMEAYSLAETEPWESEAWTKYCLDYISETRKLLQFGAQYCDSLPYSNYRLRWASQIPLRLAVKSLQLYEEDPKLILYKNKIGRKEVKNEALRAGWNVLFKTSLSKQSRFRQEAKI